MRYSVASCFLLVSLLFTVAHDHTWSQEAKHNTSRSQARKTGTPRGSPPKTTASQNGPIRVCQGVAIPNGYVIVGYETSSACPHGAYVLKKDDTQSRFSDSVTRVTPPPSSASTVVSRPRRVGREQVDTVVPNLTGTVNASNARAPTLSGVAVGTPVNAASNERPIPSSPVPLSLEQAEEEEVGEGDVVRIDTTLVTVPVSVLDRQGRFVPDLRREDFRVFENGIEQRIAYFEPTEKPFTVALLLDTSGSTLFHLWQIKEAAIAFAKQLRPQDRVLVVTFNDEVLLLTEATNDLDTVTAVIERNAISGDATRLYDAINLVINERLNKLPGRKAIVLFTDGVDTASYQATYQSTLREAEELDALIYPIQYDTSHYLRAMQNSGNITIVTNRSGWPFPGSSSTRVYNIPSTGSRPPGSTKADYERANQYLHQLAAKTGGHLYQANDPAQLNDAFSRIAEELRRQYSVGYYPQTPVQSGERRLIKVRVNRSDVAVRARDSYMQRVQASPVP